jgi:hypothetical protein
VTEDAAKPYLVGLGEIQQDAAKLLFYSLPRDGWTTCVLHYREAGPVIEVVAHITDSSGNVEPVEPPMALIDAMEALRKYMADQGNGVWLSAALKLENGRYEFDFNYTKRADWQLPPTDEAYIDDLTRFPRPDDQIPDWYPRKA